MTSEEILETEGQLSVRSEWFWLRELALQLALLNERNAQMDEYNIRTDAEESQERKANGLAELLEKANETLDQVAKPFEPRQFPGPPIRTKQ